LHTIVDLLRSFGAVICTAVDNVMHTSQLVDICRTYWHKCTTG